MKHTADPRRSSKGLWEEEEEEAAEADVVHVYYISPSSPLR